MPEVKFIDPASPVIVERNMYSINVGTRNVKAWQDVTVKVNGIITSNFNFTPDGRVTINIPLNTGANIVEVTGKNIAGTASDMATITYTKPVKVLPPAITILIPAVNPYSTYEKQLEVQARIAGVSGNEDISLSLNGINIPSFTFDNSTQILKSTVTLKEGDNPLKISASNSAGQDVKTTLVKNETRPCPVPVLTMTEPVQNELLTDYQSINFRVRVTNVTASEQVAIIMNDRKISDFSYTGKEIHFTASLNEGINYCTISATSNCGNDKISYTIVYKPAVVIVEPPCKEPDVRFSISPSGSELITHVLKGTVSNAGDSGEISLTVNGRPDETFKYVAVTGEISAQFRFGPGSYLIKATVTNKCGSDEFSETIDIEEEKPCGVRINPGNSSWEFCLVTPSDTITRDSLTNNKFSYSGPASSLFFKPIAGGGNALVNGKPYALQPGQYYLFTGNLTVAVSTNNKGSMGQWSVCINASREPVYGSGENRPQCPCEEQEREKKPKKVVEPKNDKKL